jgi:hypothetical protein
MWLLRRLFVCTPVHFKPGLYPSRQRGMGQCPHGGVPQIGHWPMPRCRHCLVGIHAELKAEARSQPASAHPGTDT